MNQGRIPPQALDFEEAILGALLIDGRAPEKVLDILSTESFYKHAHQLIFKAILELYTGNQPVDLLSVSKRLREKNEIQQVGTEAYIIELTNKVSSSARIDYHARVVVQKFVQRQIIENSARLIDLAYQEKSDVFDLLETAYADLNQVSEISVKPQEHSLGTLIDPQIEKAMKIQRGEIMPGIPTPFYRLTSKMGGWRESELIILAARPSMGKTALAIKYANHSARLGNPTVIFSLEMSKEQLTNRIISSESRLEGDKFTNTGLTPSEAETAYKSMKVFKEINLYIDDTPAISIEAFKINAKRMKSKLGIKLIVIDYLQLMRAGNAKGNREQEISKISSGIKQVAKELNIPIIALSQLSRSVEAQGGHKRPMLSHLRESGAIEQDADVVQFLYRPEYYGLDNWGEDYNGENTDGQAEYIVAKNRNGGLARNRIGFEGKFTNFYDLEEPQLNNLDLPIDDFNQDQNPF